MPPLASREISSAAPLERGRAVALALGVGALAVAACALFAPATVNGDGLGYLRAAPTGVTVPGHLGYLPLLRLLACLTGRSDPLALLAPARTLSLVAAALAAALVTDVARRLLVGRSRFPIEGALVAGLGMAASFAVLQAGADVETYAPALGAVCFAAWCAVRRRQGGGFAWVLATGAGVAAAALLHVENVVFAPAAALLCAGDRRARDRAGAILDGAGVLVVAGGAVLAAYVAAVRARGDSAATAVRWFLGAGHGFSYPLHWWTPAAALHGVAKTLVYAPYPRPGGTVAAVADTLLGLGAGCALLALARRPGRPRMLGAPVAIAWAAPFALVGLSYFGSDNERWIFLLPPVWLAAAAGAATAPRPLRLAFALVAGLVASNLALALPAARDPSVRSRADRVAALVHHGDLIISPGHSWDEYIGFYRPARVVSFPMVYFCGLDGGAAPMRARLGREAAAARRRGARIYVARADEPADSDGWKDLALFGVRPDNLGSFLPPGSRRRVVRGLDELIAPD